jgi:phage shock protein C
MQQSRRLVRSNNKMIAGVCGGIAEYYGWDPGLVRAAYVVLSIASAAFPGILVYLVLWAVIPRGPVAP